MTSISVHLHIENTTLRAERQREGIAKAKRAGVHFGRTKALTREQADELRALGADAVLVTGEDDIPARARELTGRRFAVMPVSASLLHVAARALDEITRVIPMESVFTAEAMAMLAGWAGTDDHSINDELGITLRPLQQTLAETIRALHAAGAITARAAGNLARDGAGARP